MKKQKIKLRQIDDEWIPSIEQVSEEDETVISDAIQESKRMFSKIEVPWVRQTYPHLITSSYLPETNEMKVSMSIKPQIPLDQIFIDFEKK